MGIIFKINHETSGTLLGPVFKNNHEVSGILLGPAFKHNHKVSGTLMDPILNTITTFPGHYCVLFLKINTKFPEYSCHFKKTQSFRDTIGSCFSAEARLTLTELEPIYPIALVSTSGSGFTFLALKKTGPNPAPEIHCFYFQNVEMGEVQELLNDSKYGTLPSVTYRIVSHKLQFLIVFSYELQRALSY